ncbi:mucin-7-like [Phyllostomus hastatus]|uniref:mucin-7-like n=1 Tax=Phyllostomus hastatus TaxID=9423 RepID=UPI001E6829A0|nr:mucin-7-like [Phyllostomus hastatus]
MRPTSAGALGGGEVAAGCGSAAPPKEDSRMSTAVLARTVATSKVPKGLSSKPNQRWGGGFGKFQNPPLTASLLRVQQSTALLILECGPPLGGQGRRLVPAAHQRVPSRGPAPRPRSSAGVRDEHGPPRPRKKTRHAPPEGPSLPGGPAAPPLPPGADPLRKSRQTRADLGDTAGRVPDHGRTRRHPGREGAPSATTTSYQIQPVNSFKHFQQCLPRGEQASGERNTTAITGSWPVYSKH